MDTNEYAVKIRRQIHENPELGFEEYKTQELIINEIEKLGLSYTKIKTGVICDIGKFENKEKFIALRADIDALPIEEQTNKEYSSKIKGKMHACGHDAHTAILLATLRETAKVKDKISGKVRFIFQPNEEGANGATHMIENNSISKDLKAIFGLHVKPDLETGKIGIKYDEMMAAVDELKITLTGNGGHAALPHLANDIILTASQIVIALNTIVSRNISPTQSAVISICKLHSGTNFNVLPNNCEIVGTIRTFDENIRKIIKKKIIEITENIAFANGIKSTIEINDMNSPLVNTNSLVDLIKDISIKIVGEKNTIILKEPCMGGEDFAEYLKIIDGCYFYLGVKNETKNTIYDWHHPKFDVDESAFIFGINIFKKIIEKMTMEK